MTAQATLTALNAHQHRMDAKATAVDLVAAVSADLGVQAPEVYIDENASAHAYATSLKDHGICVTTGLIDRGIPQARAVIARELLRRRTARTAWHQQRNILAIYPTMFAAIWAFTAYAGMSSHARTAAWVVMFAATRWFMTQAVQDACLDVDEATARAGYGPGLTAYLKDPEPPVPTMHGLALLVLGCVPTPTKDRLEAIKEHTPS